MRAIVARSRGPQLALEVGKKAGAEHRQSRSTMGRPVSIGVKAFRALTRYDRQLMVDGMDEDGLPSDESLVTLVERGADQTPASRLRAAIELGRRLTSKSDALIEHFVAESRTDGMSWTQIGMLFGTSKQAAQKRYRSAGSPGAWPGPWTVEVRRVLECAAEQARELHHDIIGTEHVLIALLTTREGMAGQVLLDIGVAGERVLNELAGVACEPRHPHSLTLMPRLKQSMEYSQRIATGLGKEVADTEHLLAGMLSVPDAFAVDILRRQGVTPDAARAALAQRVGVDEQQLVVPRTRRRRLFATK